MDDGGPQPRRFGIDFRRCLGEIRVVPGVASAGGKAGEPGKALFSADGLDVLIQDLLGGGRLGIGLLGNFDVIGIAVGRSAVLLGETRREPRRHVGAMAGIAGDGAHAAEILRVNRLHYEQHLARGLLDGRVFGILRGVAAAVLGVTIQAVQAQRGGDEAHRGHEFVHGNSSEYLDVFVYVFGYGRVVSWWVVVG